MLILFIFANIYIINHLKPDSTMKTTRRSTTLQAIMRTALLFTVLLSFPATIMAYEETLSSLGDKFKYYLSGDPIVEGKLPPPFHRRSDMVFNQNINKPIVIKAEQVSGKNKEYKIEVKTLFSSKGNYKDGPNFIVNSGPLSESIDIPKGTEVVLVDIDYLAVTVKGNFKEYTEYHVQAQYNVTGIIVEETAPQPWSTEEEPHCHQTDSHIRFNDYYGEVKIRCDFEEDDSYEFVDLNTVIYEYDRIKTEDDSGAILGLEDMSTYVIKPESILIIHTEEDKTSRLELIVGAIVGNWKKMLQGKSIECEMSQCVAGISGTIVAFEETGKESRVWLLAGAVDVKSKKTGKVTKLKPGQRSVTGTNGVVQVKSFNIEEGAKKFGISMDDIKNHYSNGNAPTAAQTGNATVGNGDNTIYDVTPTMPEFPGGAQAMGDYIAKNLKYPVDAKQQGKDGFVMIQFVVEKDGSRSDVKVMRNGKLPSMDKEALRVVNSMPKFSPGRNEKNQPVRVKFVVPVRFKLN